MKQVSKRDLLGLVASLPDGEAKRQLIGHMLSTGEVSEEDVAAMVVEDVRQNIAKYTEMFKEDGLLQFLLERFQEYPTYLARALVRLRPDLFYAYGFAFRLILKLKADLGAVVIPPLRPRNDPEISVFLKQLSTEARGSLVELDQECRFREYLPLMSRDPRDGFEYLELVIAEAKNAYDREILENVRATCERLLGRQFPDFVSTLNGSRFPSFHVRWWFDRVRDVPRVLNLGDTGTQKSAFAVVTMHEYGCRRVLVSCAPNARLNWQREIGLYFRDGANRVVLVRKASELPHALASGAAFTIIAYSTLIQPGVVEQLQKVGFDGFVLDECQYVTNVSTSDESESKGAKRAIACCRLVDSIPFKRICALSATPWQNHPIELAAIAHTLRPEVFPTVESFRKARPADPRFLREFLAEQVVEVELREVKDLPTITPKPWEDLFGAVVVTPSATQKQVYEFVREDEVASVRPSEKVTRLLQTTTHPHLVRGLYQWPSHLQHAFDRWELSTKLLWIRRRIERELKAGAKVVVASGIFATGVTRPEENEDDDTTPWVGQLFREWFGPERVLILDGSVSQTIDGHESSPRDRLIMKWRTDPEARILLVSMRACPDSVNLTIRALANVTKLFITCLSLAWIPWKQFLGRFWREGQGVPVEYAVPVLAGTIDENLLQLNRRKWEVQCLFRAQVPLTEEEFTLLKRRVDIERLAAMSRSNLQHVNIIGSMVRGRGERQGAKILEDEYGASTNAETFARSFLTIQEYSASGHIARCMEDVIHHFEEAGLLIPEHVLDAGCGPLTLEWKLRQPVFGVDMNPKMIELGRMRSPYQGRNAHVGYLSKLPSKWSGKFELTVASLVLDWTSMTAKIGKVPERLIILSELVRVTHPSGRIWITATRQSLSEDLLREWIAALEAQGHSVIPELTGLIRSADHGDAGRPFEFWSLCFSPNGHCFVPTRGVESFRFLFETERMKHRRAGGNGSDPVEHRRVIHERFVVTPLDGDATETAVAADRAVEGEIRRILEMKDLRGWRTHKKPNLHWRVLEQLRQRGLWERLQELGLV